MIAIRKVYKLFAAERKEGIASLLAAVILIATSLSKGMGILAESPLLHENDPVLLLPNKLFLLITSLWELAIAIILLSSVDGLKKICALSAFVGLASLYRGTFWALGISMPCPCLGYFYSWMGLEPNAADRIAIGLLVVLFGVTIAGWNTVLRKYQLMN